MSEATWPTNSIWDAGFPRPIKRRINRLSKAVGRRFEQCFRNGLADRLSARLRVVRSLADLDALLSELERDCQSLGVYASVKASDRDAEPGRPAWPEQIPGWIRTRANRVAVSAGECYAVEYRNELAARFADRLHNGDTPDAMSAALDTLELAAVAVGIRTHLAGVLSEVE